MYIYHLHKLLHLLFFVLLSCFSGPTGGWSRNVQCHWKLSCAQVVSTQPGSAAPAALAVSLHTSHLVASPFLSNKHKWTD